jgi:Rieske Fe-S protein
MAGTTMAGAGTSDALAAPISRRRALLVMGAGALAMGGFGTLLAGCGPSLPDYPVWVTIGVDPVELPVGTPVKVPLTAVWDTGSLETSTWLVRGEDGAITAYSPLCTHATCEYGWSDERSLFVCACHDAAFAVDGTVVEGPPPRPLDRWALRAEDGALEVEVTGRVRPSPGAPEASPGG